MTWTAFVEFAAKHWITVLFGLVLTGLTAGYRRLAKRIARNRAEEKALQAGVEALLADRLIQLRNYYNDKGYCPTYARQSAETMYVAYHGLGGNGMISDVFEAIKDMPLSKRGD